MPDKKQPRTRMRVSSDKKAATSPIHSAPEPAPAVQQPSVVQPFTMAAPNMPMLPYQMPAAMYPAQMYPAMQMAELSSKPGLQYVTLVEPKVLETLQAVKGKPVCITTSAGMLEGVLAEVYPDHVVLMPADGRKLFVRLCEIVYFQ